MHAAPGALPVAVRASGCCSPSYLPLVLRRPRLTSQLRSTLQRFKVRFAVALACCDLIRADVSLRTALSPLVLDDAAGSMSAAAAFVPQSFANGQPARRPHIAELFRLAYEARDLRLAPKRAKNARQRERREKARVLDAVSRSGGTALAALYRANLLPGDMAELSICDM